MNLDHKKITLVDNEKDILTLVSLSLRSQGYEVFTYENGEEALKGMEKNPTDLAILDIKMPKMNGRELLNKIRLSKDQKLKNIPIIFLTTLTDELDEVIGLRMGAVDYITKPFSQKILFERIKTVLKVHNNRMINGNSNNKEIKFNGSLILDSDKQLCYWKDNKIILTVAEFKLVQCVSKNPGVIKSREQLMDAMYGNNINVDDRTIDSHVKRIRRKFKTFDKRFNHISTRYGSGYCWRE